MIYNRIKGNLIKKINFEKHFNNFIHPSTYLNKLLFSGVDENENSYLELWNVISGEKIFEFSEFTKDK